MDCMLIPTHSGNTVTDIYAFRDVNGRTYSGYDLGGESSAVSLPRRVRFIAFFACAYWDAEYLLPNDGVGLRDPLDLWTMTECPGGRTRPFR